MEGYKGFKNYQTWSVWNWINNGEGLYNYWMNETRNTPEINELGEKYSSFLNTTTTP